MALVPRAAWDACVPDQHPFVRHAFLQLLEDSGSVTAQEGWTPVHAVARRGGVVVGVAPLYVKTHSWGEYVFDMAWAEAAGRLGHRYYPKLLCAVPFTPATGPRLLVAPGEDAPLVRAALVRAMVDLGARRGFSGVHANFLTPPDREAFASQGFLQRDGVQFFWTRDGAADWDTFMARLNSRKRKMVRKEREAVGQQGYVVRMVPGTRVTPSEWDFFHRAYVATTDRKWGGAYLTREFFMGLSAALGDQVQLCLAFQDNQPVAGALHAMGRDTLYGRQWGCLGDHAFVHFECCYYQALDFSFQHGLERVEAGAQGTHKISRGYLPHTTHSMHALAHAGLRSAVASFLERERAAVAAQMVELSELGPFRQQ